MYDSRMSSMFVIHDGPLLSLLRLLHQVCERVYHINMDCDALVDIVTCTLLMLEIQTFLGWHRECKAKYVNYVIFIVRTIQLVQIS